MPSSEDRAARPAIDDPLGEAFLTRVVDRASRVFQQVSRSTKFLDALAWPRSVEREFFAKGCEVLPRPEYQADRGSAADNLVALSELLPELAGSHVVLAWLRSIALSYVTSNQMILSLGTRTFHELSSEVYGGARSTALDHDTTNLDFAEHLARRLGPGPDGRDGQGEGRRLDADEFVAFLCARLAERRPRLELEVTKDEEISAKVVCGMTRLRVRDGATFHPTEALGLYYHEVETHALTAQNGDLQARLPFLRGGGPRTTRTQEGLAVFAEMYEHALTPGRLERLVERVRMVAMAEEGASFLDLYRYLLQRGQSPQNAYLDARRVCRGGLVEGGAPFTKDAAYLAGLIEVYNFLRVVLRRGAEHLPRLLVAGRIALEDLPALEFLRRAGVLEEPRFIPGWAARWEELVAHFAFTSFLNEVDLGPMERRFAVLLPA